MPRIYLVIPTYNESQNLPVLIKQISELKIADLNILVVDDNSPDGTGQLAEELKATYPFISVLHRLGKGGLGPAYVAGFSEVLGRGADYILQMDSDLSHDPKYLPDLLAVMADYDVALGSRYVKGGGVSNWNLTRRLISRFGNFYARNILRLPIKDVTGGFRCFKRKVLETIKLNDLSSVGYNFQIEVAYKAYRAGFKIKEVPIVFTERAGGKSKFDFGIIWESFIKVIKFKLAYNNSR